MKRVRLPVALLCGKKIGGDEATLDLALAFLAHSIGVDAATNENDAQIRRRGGNGR